jgi:hypothetical protein
MVLLMVVGIRGFSAIAYKNHHAYREMVVLLQQLIFYHLPYCTNALAPFLHGPLSMHALKDCMAKVAMEDLSYCLARDSRHSVPRWL